MPSFTCKWELGRSILYWRALFLQPHNWPLQQEQAASNQRFLFRPTYCRNERGKTLGKVFQCLFLCLEPVRESSLDLQQPQGADYWSAPSHATHCHGQIQPTAVIPTPTRPLQGSTETSGTLPSIHPHPPSAAAPIPPDSPDLIHWSLWIHDWDIQNVSQITLLH